MPQPVVGNRIFTFSYNGRDVPWKLLFISKACTRNIRRGWQRAPSINH
jgi:hypothetical protein